MKHVNESLRVAVVDGRSNALPLNTIVQHSPAFLRAAGIRCEAYSARPDAPGAHTAHSTTVLPFPSLLTLGNRTLVAGRLEFQRSLMQFQPDIVHIEGFEFPGRTALRIARKLGIPVVASHVHSDRWIPPALKGLHWNLLRSRYALCNRVLIHDREARDQLSECGIRNAEWIPTGVDTRTFSPEHRSEAWKEEAGIAGRKLLVVDARGEHLSSIRTAARVWTSLGDTRESMTLLLLGREDQHHLVRKALLTALFVVPDRDETSAQLLASADAYFTTGRSEEHILEAMASGLPVVAIDNGTTRELFHHERIALLCKEHDPAGAAGLIRRVLQEPDTHRHFSHLGIEAAAERSWNRVFRRLLESYHATISAACSPHGRKAA